MGRGRLVAQGRMGPFAIAIGHPGDDAAGAIEAEQPRRVQEFVAPPPVEGLADAVSRIGLPGAMPCQGAPVSSLQASIAFEVNSGPWSLTIRPGLPCRATRRPEIAIATTAARHSLPASRPGWQRRAAGLPHGLRYLRMIAMPLSGLIRVRAGGHPIGLLDLSGTGPWIGRSQPLASATRRRHEASGLTLIARLVLNPGAVLDHARMRRDVVWVRMWPPRPRRPRRTGRAPRHVGRACQTRLSGRRISRGRGRSRSSRPAFPGAPGPRRRWRGRAGCRARPSHPRRRSCPRNPPCR